jgi:hypothetical protein
MSALGQKPPSEDEGQHEPELEAAIRHEVGEPDDEQR